MAIHRIVGKSSLIVTLCATLALFASGQSYNVDLDNEFAPPPLGGGAPSTTFGAACQVGYWNKVSASGQDPFFLKNLSGELTGVTFITPNGGFANGFNNPDVTGDFALLLNDGRSHHDDSWTFSGIANGGYRLYTYAVRPSGVITNTSVTVLGATVPVQIVWGPPAGNQFMLGQTHCIHEIGVANNSLTVRVQEGISTAYTNGFQLVQLSNYVEPTSYTVIQGLNFGGSLASILDSDDLRASILSDEFDSNGEFEFMSNLPAGIVSQLKFRFEGRASRSDLSQFLKMRNYASGTYSNVNVQTATLSDSIAEGSISSGVSNYYSASREVKARATWIPQNDITAMDGWVESCDQAMWEMVF